MSQDHLQQQTAISTTATSTYHQHPQQHFSENSNSNSNSISNNNNNNNNSYRPCSPDLSAYTSPDQQQPRHQLSSLFRTGFQESSAYANNNDVNSASSWQHQYQQQQQGGSAALTGLPTGSSGYSLATHRGSYDASPYFSPPGSGPLSQASGLNQGSYFVGGKGSGSGNLNIGGQQQGQEQLQRRQTFGLAHASANVLTDAGEYSSLTHSPTTISSGERVGAGIASLSLQHPPGQQSHHQSLALTITPGFSDGAQSQPRQDQLSINQPFSFSPSHQPPSQYNMPPVRRKRVQTDENNDDGGDLEYAPDASSIGGAVPKSSRKRKSDHGQAERAPGEVGPSMGIDVKTKFPVARIKRIMQADEDVGKVAQATPTAVSKALELFMITLVTKAAAEAKDRSSKRITAAHLKQAVVKDQTFDFLQEIIEKIADPTEKKGGRAASEDVDDGEGAPAKRKRTRRGRKKTDDNDD